MVPIEHKKSFDSLIHLHRPTNFNTQRQPLVLVLFMNHLFNRYK